MASTEPRVSVVVPLRDGARSIGACLDALSLQLGPGDELFVVDDRSRDDGPDLAAAAGATVLRLPPGERGAGAARNLGARVARGRTLVFLDADVVIEAGSLARLLAPLEGRRAQATIGVYAPCPTELGLCSRVKDRSVRVRHRGSGERIGWFWTAFAALDRGLFEELGGFDTRRFQGATIEDMELGYRIARQGGTVLQRAEARATHRHRFGLRSLARNDFAKSRDWTRALLLHGPRELGKHRATHPRELLALGCSLLGLGGAAAPWAWPLALVGWGGLAVCLQDELRAAVDERGWAEAGAQLAVRGTLYPVVIAGTAAGLLADLLEAR
jgi:glycosyltransferase involved in cell wall biosynthesis